MLVIVNKHKTLKLLTKQTIKGQFETKSELSILIILLEFHQYGARPEECEYFKIKATKTKRQFLFTLLL